MKKRTKVLMTSLAVFLPAAAIGVANVASAATETKAAGIDGLTNLGTVSLSGLRCSNPFGNPNEFLDLYLDGSDYADVDGTSAICFADRLDIFTNFNECVKIYKDDVEIAYNDVRTTDAYVNFWTYHPTLDVMIYGLRNANKVTLNKGLVIPSYAWVTGNTASPTYGYYTLDKNYVATLEGDHDTQVSQERRSWSLTAEDVVTDVTVTNIHVRNSSELGIAGDDNEYMLFFLSQSDYIMGPISNLGKSTFLDKTHVYTKDGRSLTLRELTRNDYGANYWGENNAFFVGIDTSTGVNAMTIDYVTFDEGCTFIGSLASDYFNVQNRNMRNVGATDIGWSTSFVNVDNCYDVSFLDGDELQSVYRHQAGEEVIVPTCPTKPGFLSHWVVKDNVVTISNGKFTMPNANVVLYPEYTEITYEPVTLDINEGGSFIELRNSGEIDQCNNLYMVFLLSNDDYRVNQQPLTDFGESTFMDGITIYADGNVYSLREVYNANETIFTHIWGEDHSIGIPVDGSKMNAANTAAIRIAEGTTFPSTSGTCYYEFQTEENYFMMPSEHVGWNTRAERVEENVHEVTYTMDDEVIGVYPGAVGRTTSCIAGPAEEGYEVIWEDAEGAVAVEDNSFVMPDADVTLAGTVTPITYSIQYVGLLEGEAGNNPTTYTVEDTIVLNNPTRAGYEFLGWTSDEVTTPTLTMRIEEGTTGNKVFTAHFEAITFTVTFDVDGGTPVEGQTVIYGETVVEPADPTKDGYDFGGWYLGEEKYDFATPVTSNITLKAKWQQTVKVTFDSDGGSFVSSQFVAAGEKATEPRTPTKTGYTFLGWYYGETLWNFDNPVTEDITLKARWEANQPSSSSTSSSEGGKGGCGGSIVAGSVMLSGLAIGAAMLLKKKRK